MTKCTLMAPKKLRKRSESYNVVVIHRHFVGGVSLWNHRASIFRKSKTLVKVYENTAL